MLWKLYFRKVVSLLSLTLSWRRLLSYRNQSIDLLRKLMDWFLYDNGLRHESVKRNQSLKELLAPSLYPNKKVVRTNSITTCRSNHHRCSIKKPTTLLKKRLYHRCFPVSFTKFLRIIFLQRTSVKEEFLKILQNDNCFCIWNKFDIWKIILLVLIISHAVSTVTTNIIQGVPHWNYNKEIHCL